jgi:hypothetical protein
MMGAGYNAKRRVNTGAPAYDYFNSDDYFNSRADFYYKYSLIPRRCYNTNRWIWGVAVRGRRVITGPGDPVIEDRWYHRHEAIIMMLKGL